MEPECLSLLHGQDDLARAVPAPTEESLGAELTRRVVVGENHAAVVGIVWVGVVREIHFGL